MKKSHFIISSVFGLSAMLLSSQYSFADGANKEAIQLNSTATVHWKLDGKKRYPSFISGDITKLKIHSEKDVYRFIDENTAQLKSTRKNVLKLISKKKDHIGMTHYTFKPVIEGVPIAESAFKIHVKKDGSIAAVNGELYPDAPGKLGQYQKLTKQDAIRQAWKAIGPEIQGKDVSDLHEKGDLSVFNEENQYILAYHIQLQYTEPAPSNWQVWINAENGKVLKKGNKVHTIKAEGSGTGVLGDTKSLMLDKTASGNYEMIDKTRPMKGGIYTYDNKHRSYSLPGLAVTDSDPKFLSKDQRSAVDAHYYAGKVFDFFYKNFGRVSYDNKGGNIISSVHYGNNYNNAMWNGSQMIYGDGDGQLFAPLSGAPDIVAHELTHAITERTANLAYENQSGALNESISDVFGYFMDPDDWEIGENVYTPGQKGDALRSLKEPELYGQPGNMKDYKKKPNTEKGDYGGVHVNSGIPNKAAYNTIKSIGLKKSEQIYYRALTEYLTSKSDFRDAKDALAQSAEDLYGRDTAAKVKSSWAKIGV